LIGCSRIVSLGLGKHREDVCFEKLNEKTAKLSMMTFAYLSTSYLVYDFRPSSLWTPWACMGPLSALRPLFAYRAGTGSVLAL